MSISNYQTLGKSGLRVSPMTLGTMTFGEDWGWGASPEVSHELLHYYIDQGGNSIDTANIYTKGHSEKIIGDFISSNDVRRDSLVISTKFFGNMYPYDPNTGGTGRKAIIQNLEDSLRRLKTDYIDLYWMHAFDPYTPIEETLSALNDLIHSGKIRYIAISDTSAWKITQAQVLSQLRGWSSFIGLQLEYSLLERTVESEFIPMANEMGLGIMAWAPLKEGLLSGKYTRENRGTKQSVRNEGRISPELSEETYVIIDKLIEIAKNRNTAVSSISLAWVMHQKNITSTLVGARTLEQLKQNLHSTSVELSNDEIEALSNISKPILQFPYPLLQGTRDLLQAGTTINNNKSLIAEILPQKDIERY